MKSLRIISSAHAGLCWLRRLVMRLCLRWKYRRLDPDVCCCGNLISRAKPYDSICAHGGCRSLKEYCITEAMKAHNDKCSHGAAPLAPRNG